MKLHFEPDLEYQWKAIESVCDIFRGQENCRSEFTVSHFGTTQLRIGGIGGEDGAGLQHESFGIGNRLQLLDDEILKNLEEIQLRNCLKPSSVLSSGDFTVEMETGTGKTYVYLRTIFELNRRFGFTKFVIVVPSVAIKEGVFKTLEITEEHFRSIYSNVPFQYFIYDSSKLGQVRAFATSPNIQIMIVTVGAINKTEINNFYKDSEKTGGEKPIELIKATRPILIVDEPQSVDGGLKGEGREALLRMNPLCTLRYSATHVDKHHMVYRLDAVDAYEQKLVKQIEIASLAVESAHNKSYIKLVSTSNKGGSITAKVELDVQGKTAISRKQVTVQAGDDLEQITGRAIYSGLMVKHIGCKVGDEYLDLSNVEKPLQLGACIGDVDADALKRLMIRRTIDEHLDKELRLRSKGIKVLSLFFIDLVENYRSYGADGVAQKGKYALMFEEEYAKAITNPKYRTLFGDVDTESDPSEVHDGYFSIDKQKRWADTAETSQSRNSENAERAYNLIMRDKEKLLSFDSKLKFIFSHSALREGWDNPNVFQICAIRDIGTERERRQTIGRGLRICVNQDGERVRGFDVNTLTVVATEGYEEFAENLQKEIERDTGIRFGVIEKHQFASVVITTADGNREVLGFEKSQTIWNHLKAAGYVDSKGNAQNALKTAIKENSVDLPQDFENQRADIVDILRKLAGKLEIKNADDRVTVKARKGVLQSEEFRDLWDRIKARTTYRVEFDNEKMISDCVEAVRRCPPVTKTFVRIRKADLEIGRGGIAAEETSSSAPMAIEEELELPDLVTELQDKTQLTRRSIVTILLESGRLNDFCTNPQEYLDLVAEAILRSKRLAIVDGIKYHRIGNEYFYAQELFETEELAGYLKKNMMEATKSVYEHVVYDSGGVEYGFAQDLEKNEAVKLYTKLPSWFKIQTPLGSYNPDWAVLVELDGTEKLFLVVETKASLFAEDLRDNEHAKIQCGKAHFKAIAEKDNPARFVVAKDIDDMLINCL